MDTWIKISSLALNIVQAVAIVVGGSWVYFKFLRSRTFARRAELDVEASIQGVNGGQIVKVEVTLKNAGLSKLPLRLNRKVVMVSGVQSDERIVGANLIWHDYMITPIFTAHQWVEPQEIIQDEVLVPVDSAGGKWLAFRAEVVVTGQRPWFQRRDPVWSAPKIIMASDTIANTNE